MVLFLAWCQYLRLYTVRRCYKKKFGNKNRKTPLWSGFKISKKSRLQSNTEMYTFFESPSKYLFFYDSETKMFYYS